MISIRLIFTQQQKFFFLIGDYKEKFYCKFVYFYPPPKDYLLMVEISVEAITKWFVVWKSTLLHYFTKGSKVFEFLLLEYWILPIYFPTYFYTMAFMLYTALLPNIKSIYGTSGSDFGDISGKYNIKKVIQGH